MIAHRKLRTLPSRGFTLIEILVVVSIMAILVSLSVATLARSGSVKLTTAGNFMVDQLNLAHQTAMANNCLVEFRIYQLPDAMAGSSSTPTVHRAFQAFTLDSTGLVATPLTKLMFLPDGVKISSTVPASTLLDAKNPPTLVSGTVSGKPLMDFPPGSYNYFAFHFKPNGSTDLNPNSAQSWHLSLMLQKDPVLPATGLPANFFTAQIDPQNGRVRCFRPN